MVPKYMPQGQPILSDKLEAFNAMCGKMENCSKLYTIKEFHKAMQKKKMTIVLLKQQKSN